MSARSLNESATALLTEFRGRNDAEESLRLTLLAFLGSAPDGCLRKHVPGHITASALVMDDNHEKVLLTLHPKVGKWIQLGGHCEKSDETIVDAALREATEESGIEDLRIDPKLLHLHTHPITCSLGVPTRHLDLRFLVHARPDAQPVISNESVDLAWWPIDALPENREAGVLEDMIALANAR
ncbi:NUDIX hydrolase [Smaragdicoccus niigatensis]|uniref:NUDIX hydrolase n=1 Tax=Smaragdicoccus niigatensis TaxID=359359 RepID=UPI000377781B|nr:NUDIX domain-containing protein [Smaragdicoccus niigatensis]